MQARCQIVTLSTVNPAYAALAWPAKLSVPCAKIAANGLIVERRTRTSWLLAATGSSFQCPVKSVPPPVARDLAICHSPKGVTRHEPRGRRRRAG